MVEITIVKKKPYRCSLCGERLKRVPLYSKSSNKDFLCEYYACGCCKNIYFIYSDVFKHRKLLNISITNKMYYEKLIIKNRESLEKMREKILFIKNEVKSKITSDQKDLEKLNLLLERMSVQSVNNIVAIFLLSPYYYTKDWLVIKLVNGTFQCTSNSGEITRIFFEEGKGNLLQIMDNALQGKYYSHERSFINHYCVLNFLFLDREIVDAEIEKLKKIVEKEEKENELRTIIAQENRIKELIEEPVPRFNDDYHTVVVYKKLSNKCTMKNHLVEPVTVETKNIATGQTIEVNAYYCKECEEFFINSEALFRDYHKHGIFPNLSYDFYSVKDNLHDESLLKALGYSVQEGYLTKKQRQNLLKCIIDNKRMDKHQIIHLLEHLITFNGKKANLKSAKEKWEQDLIFVSEYTEDNKKKIKAEFVDH